ncbi:MAG TPA: AAA family ATPase, partial [Chloroflexota bacterium]|nr:AAA family ATPase [Chloroflexota bacterium]
MENGQTLAFGTVLRRARRAAALTQEEVAERAGVSVRTVSDLERGVAHAPRPDTVNLLAEALGMREGDRAAFEGAAGRLRTPRSLVPSFGPRQGGRPLSPFVGRRHELALLDGHLAGQGPPVLLLAGEPGIGKTRLLHVAAPQAIGRGLAVLEGGCQRRGGQEPYAPLLAALKGYLRRQAPGRQRATLRGCAWLVRLLPELADGPIEPLPAWMLSPEQERRLMFDATARVLTNIAEQSVGAGILLLLDDLQWAGSDALDLLTTLARSAADIALRVIGAYRDTEVGPQDRLSATLADLAHAGLAACHALNPLALDEARQLLTAVQQADRSGGPEEATQRERLVRRTGGVPFFLISYAQAMRGAVVNEEAPRGGDEQAIPWTVTQTIQQRVAALPESTRDVLRAAAVVGRIVEPALIIAVTAQAEHDVLTAIDTAGRARLLQEENRAFRFAHDIIREVIEADLGPVLRPALYRRVAGALEQDPRHKAAPERLAYLYTQGDVLDKAALYLERAGDLARHGYANTAAEGYYRDAAAHLGALGHRAEAARVREKQGAVLRMLGRHGEALATFEQAVDTHHAAGDLGSMARALAETWLLHAEGGTAEEGAQRFQTVVDLLEAQGGQSTGLAVLYSAQANLFSSGGNIHGLLHAATRAMELAGATGDVEVRAEAEIKRGLALTSIVGDVEAGLQAYFEAARLGEAAGGMTNLAGWYNLISGVHDDQGELEQSLHAHARSREVAEQQGNLLRIEIARIRHGSLALHVGDWGRADADLSQAVAAARRMGAVRQMISALLELGRLRMAQGDWDTAGGHLEEVEELARR